MTMLSHNRLRTSKGKIIQFKSKGARSRWESFNQARKHGKKHRKNR